ncbi:uncharacterized protein LOC141645968 [Silene latifolia]|uniref:uncharacterized protein LOC141645968 n=1 Tax=Silene latifolia TaxID=37657 RepID=UPI003D78A2A9
MRSEMGSYGGFHGRSRMVRRDYFYNRNFPARRRNFNRRHQNQWRLKGGFQRHKVWRRKDEIVSIFVDNINRNTTTETIKSHFMKFGEISDVFISSKRRANNPNYFGFVKMKGPRNASTAIQQMRGRWVDNSRIFVQEARFQQRSHNSGANKGFFWSNPNMHDGPNKVEKEVVKPKHKNHSDSQDSFKPIEEDKIVNVQINPNMVEELERSLIGESEEPRSVEVLSQILTNQWRSISKVRDLGPYKFIITFLEKSDMEHALSLKESLLMQYFSQVFPWDIYQQGDTRRIWIEVMGIPPQVWSRKTFELIAAKFGVLVCCDVNCENPDSFVTCRLMIDTNIMSYIAEVLYININEHFIGKSIFVREGTNLTTCYINQPVRNLVSFDQWDDTLSVRLEPQSGQLTPVEGCARVSGTVVEESPVGREEPNGSERTITCIGNVNYDINEEFELISNKRVFNASLGNSNNTILSDDDCPPGFQKIINTKKSKRKLKKFGNYKNPGGATKKSKKKVKDFSDEIADAQFNDSIECWSEDVFEVDRGVKELSSDDDFESDPELEEIKAKEFGRSLGLGVGDKLSIEDLLL